MAGNAVLRKNRLYIPLIVRRGAAGNRFAHRGRGLLHRLGRIALLCRIEDRRSAIDPFADDADLLVSQHPGARGRHLARFDLLEQLALLGRALYYYPSVLASAMEKR